MEKIKLLERAKFYSEQLRLGIEPISGIRISENNPYNTEKMRNYFEFVSDILGEILDNNGVVRLPGNEKNSLNKKTFNASFINKKEVYIGERAVKPIVLVNRINYVADKEKTGNFSLTVLNKWLVENNYLEAHKELSTIRKTVYELNNNSRRIGIRQREYVDRKTGEIKKILLLSKEAQEFILDNLDKMK